MVNWPVIPATVLDPFVGSGTTCLAAKRLGRHSIGIDLSEAYLKMAMKRIRQLALALDARPSNYNASQRAPEGKESLWVGQGLL